MNHLAHLLLAEPSPQSRLGNVAADYIWHREIAGLPPAVRRGVKQHQHVDAFTDHHPAVRRSVGRLDARWGWFGGILIDVYYDHLLAESWADRCPVPLERWAFEVNADLLSVVHLLPTTGEASVRRIAETNRLVTYRELSGVEAALVRLTWVIRERIPQRAVDLTEALPELAGRHAELADDFATFWPQLAAFSAGWCAAHPPPG